MQTNSDKRFLVIIFVVSGLCNVNTITFLHDGNGGWKQGAFIHKNEFHPPKDALIFDVGNFNNIETYRVIHEGFSHEDHKRQRTVKFLHNEIPSYDKLPVHGQINHVQVLKNDPNGKTHFHTVKVIHEIATPAASNNVHAVSQLHTKVTPSSSIKRNFWSRPMYPRQHQYGNFYLKN